MIAEHYSCEAAAAVVVGVLVTASWTLALSDPPAAASNEEMENHRLVVSNMTSVFQAFGLGGQQAEMLARQTADFGTLGAMDTVATVGIPAGPADDPIASRPLPDACAADSALPRTAQTAGGRAMAAPLHAPTRPTRPRLDWQRSM